MSLNLKYFLVLFISFATTGVFGQTINKPIVDFTNTKIYEIGGIKVTGAKFSDENAIISVSGLKNGEKLRVPGEEIGYALKKLLRLKLFSDVQIFQEKLIGDVIFLEIRITELPRLTRYSFQGVKKSQHEDLQKIVDRFIPGNTLRALARRTPTFHASVATITRQFPSFASRIAAARSTRQQDQSSRLHTEGCCQHLDRAEIMKKRLRLNRR